MFKCEYCGKIVKSKGGLTAHMKSCKAKPQEIVSTVEEIGDEVVVTTQAIDLDIVGTEDTYYEGHPRREIKLRGLLSRTLDTAEREKIAKIFVTEC